MNIEKFVCVAEAVAKYYGLGYVTRAYDDCSRMMVNDTTQRQVLITKVGFLEVEAAEMAVS
jgi:hypothetical protein